MAGKLINTVLKSSAWVIAVMPLSLLFIVWSISTIVAVNRMQAEVAVKARVITKITLLEQSLREFGDEAAEANFERARVNEVRWMYLHSLCKQQMSDVETAASDEPAIRENVEKMSNALARMDKFNLIKSGDAKEIARNEFEFRSSLNDALALTGITVKTVREQMSGLSLSLITKWRQLSALVVVSCMLYFARFEMKLFLDGKTNNLLENNHF
jgi:hypothetical protein